LVAVIFISSALWRYYRFAEIFEREESSKLSTLQVVDLPF